MSSLASHTVAHRSIAGLTDDLGRGDVTSVGLLQHSLGRIRALDPQLGAFLHTDEAGALAAAERSDERRRTGQALGPLDGVPLALKDNLAQEDQPLTAGSRILQGYRAPYDATVVRRLKDAGAVLVGRCNCDEFAMGSSTENSAFQLTRNPWDQSRTPGGSSGGSAAAVAAALVPGALGSDTGGSIRQPASFCGVVGFKPTYGRVSRFGLVAFASSLDQVGAFALDVRSAALLVQTISGHDARDATSSPTPVPDLDGAARAGRSLRGVRVGVPRALLHSVTSDVRRVLDDTIAACVQAGATVVDVSLPHAERSVAAYYVVATAEASSNLARFDGVRYGPRQGAERGLAGMLEDTRALFGDEVKRRILLGTWALSVGYSNAYYLTAQRVRRLIADGFSRAFASCDLVLLPTAPEPAFSLGAKTSDPLLMYAADLLTIPASLAGLPALSFPAGFSSSTSSSTSSSSAPQLPIGMQLVAPAFREDALVAAAAALEHVLAIATTPPALSSNQQARA